VLRAKGFPLEIDILVGWADGTRAGVGLYAAEVTIRSTAV